MLLCAPIRKALLDNPGLTKSEVAEIVKPRSDGAFRVALHRLERRGDIIRIHRKYYPTERLILSRGVCPPRGKGPAVEALEDGNVRVLGRELDPERAELLIRRLQEVIP